jgi:prepilin-type N-terminal cleavage/methylation domain-containing protein
MNKQKSFTLIELLVVIVIIGILAGVIMISTSSSIDKANFAKAQAFSETVQNELLLNLVSEWSFDNSLNLGEDTWGNNNGTLCGAAGSQNLPQIQSTENCVYGTCLKFDGYDDYVRVNDNEDLNFTDEFTMCAWVKKAVLNTFEVIFIKGNWSQYVFRVESNNRLMTKMFFSDLTSTDEMEHDNASILDSDWHHACISFTNSTGTIRHYIDGRLGYKWDNDLWKKKLRSTSEHFSISRDTSNRFNGLIDDVKIYNAVLSSSQIKQNYIAGLDSLLSKGNISKEEYRKRINELAVK